MDLKLAAQQELIQILPTIKQVLTFSVGFNAAIAVIGPSGESGVFLVIVSMTALLILIGAQMKCKDCHKLAEQQWWAAILMLVENLLSVGAQVATSFCGNLLAKVLVNTVQDASDTGWVVWWTVIALSFTSIAHRLALD